MKRLFLQKKRLAMLGGWLCLAMVLLAGQGAWAQAPAWQGAIATPQLSTTSTNVFATAADANGNVYLAGSFSGTMNFGAFSLTSAGMDDGFVAKWNASSNSFVWAKRLGGTADDYGYGVAVSGANVYVVGAFRSASADFGPTTLTNAGGFGNADGFVAKLTDAGSNAAFAWTLPVAGAYYDFLNKLVVNGPNVYVLGSFTSPTLSIGTATLTNYFPLKSDAFVSKVVDAGATASFVWTCQVGGVDEDFAYALALSGAAVYVGGNTRSPTVHFGATSLAGPTTTGTDGFLAKLTDAGSTSNFEWVQQVPGSGSETIYSTAVNGANVYVTGIFSGAALQLGSTALVNSSTRAETFVAKLTDGGNSSAWAWALQCSGNEDDYLNALAVNGTSVYAAGGFLSNALRVGNTTLTSPNGAAEALVTKCIDNGTTGAWAWAQQSRSVGAGSQVYAMDMNSGRIYVAGNLTGTTNFGGFQASSLNTGLVGYVAWLPDAPLATANPTTTAAAVQLSPNPAHETVVLTGLTGTAGPATATLHNALGQLVRTVALAPAGGQAALSVAGLPAGVYAVRVQAGGLAVVRRLVVE